MRKKYTFYIKYYANIIERPHIRLGAFSVGGGLATRGSRNYNTQQSSLNTTRIGRYNLT